MQRSQSVCASAASRLALLAVVLCLLVLSLASNALAQVNTAALSGTVVDPQGLAVKGAKLTLTSSTTGAERTAVADDSGHYNFVGVPPGRYKLTVDGGASFASFEASAVTLTVGEDANFDPRLELRGVQQTITVSSDTAPIETTKTEVSQTIEQRRIDNLPINGRNYINFTLTNSQTTRDVSPTIGPAPNSGLSIGGSRARGNMVSVDGADAGDNSVNGIRSTISQEGVQEFQLILSNYNAEYGRATGGVINIITKSGTNDFHGDVFGYFRNKAFQSRNSFSGQIDPTTGALDPTKQAYTRVQTGLTFGGPLKKDKTFYFFSYEYTQREESGFASIGIGNFGLTTGIIPCIPFPLSLTADVGSQPGQLTTYQQILTGALNAGASCNDATTGPILKAALATAASSNVALSGDINRNVNGVSVPLASTLGLPFPGTSPVPFFPGPVPCLAGGPQVNKVLCGPSGMGLVPLPASFVPLNSVRGNYPVTEKTSLWSARLDQRWSNRNSSFLRVGISPSLATGLPSTSQNQVFGQNAGSRTGLSQSRDFSITAQHDTIVSATAFNEFRFQYARRGLHFGFSKLPGGDQIGVNIPGFAYFGREPYSPVNRIERRTEFTDHVTLIRGKHTFKFGGDGNLIQLRSSKKQIFELDFGGDVTFGGLPLFGPLPPTTGFQSYGLGFPTTYIQGIGNSNSPFDNLPFGFFAQDSWRVNRKLALNFGVRYDVEISPLFSPATAVNAAAEKALGVVEGIPRNYKNVAPRFGLAWDPLGDGKTVIRAGYGLFYDHPLLAVAFDAATADGGRSVQLLSAVGNPSACGLLGPPAPPVCGPGLDGPQNLNGSSIFQGVLNADSIHPAFPNSLTLGYFPDQQRFDPFAAGSLLANQNYLAAGFPLPILPFTLPVAKDFKYAYAQQANLTVERQLAGSWKVSVGYQYTRGIHLNGPVDVNSTDPQLMAVNFADCLAAGLTTCGPSPILTSVPGTTVTTKNGCTFSPVPGLAGALGFLSGCPGPLAVLNNTPVATPGVFNYFRPSGPNPSFAGPGAAFYPLLVGAAGAACFPAGFLGPGAAKKCYPTGFLSASGAPIPVPFNSVDAQLSIGNSDYHGMTLNVSKRFSRGFEFLSSYTWSHSIDDSTDLQSPLEPQDSRFPHNERANSVNDQRHRWVTSAVFQSPSAKSGDGFFRHLTGDFSLSPIVELSSGRPFNIIVAGDTRLDLGASQDRPSVGGNVQSPFIPGATFGPADVCLDNSGKPFTTIVPGVTPPEGCTGNLGRNRFNTSGFFTWDMRLSRRIPLGERLKLDLIADAFNLFNRTNIAAVNQLCDPSAACLAGQPTASYDARQFQFALKLSW
jgi:hypothetical protein